MKLYDNAMSPNAKRVRVLARELGIALELVPLDLRKGENRTPGYLGKNPMGKIPTLEDGGLVLWESPAILVHLARQHGSRLFPADQEVEALRWMFWNASHFEVAIFTVMMEKLIKPEFLGETADRSRVEAGTRDFARYAPVLEAHLRGRSWIAGEQLSVADVALGTSYDLVPLVGLPDGPYQAVRAWHQRLRARPSWA
jgi:glutathione S-transferase